LIRVELIYGHRSFLDRFFADLSAVWLSVGLGIAVALSALYFVPFADLWSSMEQVGLSADEVVAVGSEEGLLPPVVSEQRRPPAQAAAAAILLPTIATSTAQEQENTEAVAEPENGVLAEDMAAPMLVLPPIGGGDVAVAAAAPAEHIAPAGDSARYTTACQTAIKIKNLIPGDVKWGLLSCSGAGEFELSGSVANRVALRQLERALQERLVGVSSASWPEAGGHLYFVISGRLLELEGGGLATLSSEEARRLFRKVEHWADQCGIDAIAFSEPTATALKSEQMRQRRKLVGTGSYLQIATFLGKLRAAEETAALGELILNPVQADGYSSAEARLSVAIDVVVGAQ
jgi:hypothetical protein